MPPAVSAALTNSVPEPEPDARFAGLPTAAIRRELRCRKLASRSRDVKANPGNINGVHKTAGECGAAVRRQILAYGRRVGSDADALGGLAGLHAVVEEATGIACRELTRPGRYPWAEWPPGWAWAGRPPGTGTTRQTAPAASAAPSSGTRGNR